MSSHCLYAVICRKSNEAYRFFVKFGPTLDYDELIQGLKASGFKIIKHQSLNEEELEIFPSLEAAELLIRAIVKGETQILNRKSDDLRELRERILLNPKMLKIPETLLVKKEQYSAA
ncbi:MAG TPA: hypothetical protein VF817_05180 [Patescibacteria group bacterium]